MYYKESPPKHEAYCAAVSFSFWSFSSIFFLAARIISSLRFCSSDCLSVLFWDHPGLDVAFSEGEEALVVASELSLILDERLYLVIRSGCDGFAWMGVEVRELVAGVPARGVGA